MKNRNDIIRQRKTDEEFKISVRIHFFFLLRLIIIHKTQLMMVSDFEFLTKNLNDFYLLKKHAHLTLIKLVKHPHILCIYIYRHNQHQTTIRSII